MDILRSKNYLLALICSLSLLKTVVLHSQNNGVNHEDILGHWVNYYSNRQDTVVFIPFDSPAAQELPLYDKFMGITFMSDNVCRHHQWRRCGNDTGPAHLENNWSLRESDSQLVLQVGYPDSITKTYKVEGLTKNRITLVPLF